SPGVPAGPGRSLGIVLPLTRACTLARLMPRHTKAAASAAALQSRLWPAFIVSPGAYPRALTVAENLSRPTPYAGSVRRLAEGDGEELGGDGGAAAGGVEGGVEFHPVERADRQVGVA